MIKVLSTNITSPLGFTTKENYQSIKNGRSALSVYHDWKGVPSLFTASLFNEDQAKQLEREGFTRFESMAIYSILEAISHTDVDVSSERTGLVISTTKANVEELSSSPDNDGDYRGPGQSAVKIARALGFTTDPIVVCNACISGVTAQVLADRLISGGSYDTMVVCGADCQSAFVVAGFMSFKSLSPYECRPFDIERLGLNLGEAAATIVFGKVSATDSDNLSWKLVAGSLNNDAYHVSAPSPDGDGTYRAARSILEHVRPDSLATVSVHGTATMFNDQMESKAIERAQLSDVPVSALKGYYGHTLGAAGVLETIITMEAADDGIVLPVRGYSEIGVSGRVNISDQCRTTGNTSFIKLISGFGGCNGAVAFAKTSGAVSPQPHKDIHTLSTVRISPSSLVIDGEVQEVSSTGRALLTEIYKTYIGDYPKFHKMDVFTKVAFLAADILAQRTRDNHDEERAVILFNSSSSIVADRKHIATFEREGEFYPSPSVFLYTLPNIVTGEISIRHGYKGETSLYIIDGYNEQIINKIVETTFLQSPVRTMMTGWVDCRSEDDFEANIKLVTI